MAHPVLRTATALALTAALSAGLAGCASGPHVVPTPTTTNTVKPTPVPTMSADPIIPMVVDLAAVPNALVDVPAGSSLVINVGDPQDWTGMTLDPKVAVFVPGGVDGSAVLNPSFTAVGAGQTKVKMANVTSGDTVEFTISVQ